MDHTNDNIFQVSVKALYINDQNKVLMIQEQAGDWELPGGRMQKGETFLECLYREVLEETGLECEVPDQQPHIVYPAIDKEGRGRIMVFFKVIFPNLDFKPSAECKALRFFSKDEIRMLNTYPQLKPLPDFL